MGWTRLRLINKQLRNGVAPKVRTGGSATTGQAAPPPRNIHLPPASSAFTALIIRGLKRYYPHSASFATRPRHWYNRKESLSEQPSVFRRLFCFPLKVILSLWIVSYASQQCPFCDQALVICNSNFGFKLLIAISNTGISFA